MFCTINLVETKKRFSRNVVITNESIGELSFLKVVIYKKSALKKVEKRLKSKVKFAIVSKNIKDYDFEYLKIYNNDEYLINIAKHTFKYILKLMSLNPKDISVCVVDRECKHPEFVASLANRAGIVKVVTNDIDKYLTVSDSVLEDFGTSLVVKTTVSDTDFGIDLNETPYFWFGTKENCFELTNECVKIGSGFRKFVPQGISQCDFAGAIHKFREFKRLKLLNSDLLFKNGKYYEINKNNIKKFLDNR